MNDRPSPKPLGWTPSLFEAQDGSAGPNAHPGAPAIELETGAWLLPGFALSQASELLAAIKAVSAAAPFRALVTPGGHEMSVAMTSCGEAGWVSDEHGYRYAKQDPISGEPWPAMPTEFAELGPRAARAAGFEHFEPSAAILNRYAVGSRLSLHQDRDEQDLSQPIVSLSLGLPAVFLLGGFERSAPTQRRLLEHGDVVVWGGPSRLRYHGVQPIKPARHPIAGPFRYNVTFRSVKR